MNIGPKYFAARFIIQSDDDTNNLFDYVCEVVEGPIQNPPLEVIFRPYKRRRSGHQNSRYWATLRDNIDAVAVAVDCKADDLGYSPLEIRRLVGEELDDSGKALAFCLIPEAAHEIMKLICGVTTSTDRGTTEFSKLHERMDLEMAVLAGAINALGA